MKLGGFVGEVEYRGELREFVPLLKLGEQIHLGKGTGFGLGKYVLVDAEHEPRTRNRVKGLASAWGGMR
jgi:hypothetical protein